MEKQENHGGPPPRNPWEIAAAAGAQLVVSVLLGVVAGRWLDGRLKTAPWLTLAGTMAGIGIGLYNLIRETGGKSRG